MKEIWIEKLGELLREYVQETDFWDNFNEYNEAEILDEETLEVNWKYHDIEYLYTKKFWFIKWLVNENKIDTDKLEKIWYEKIIYEYYWQYKTIVEYSDYESLLMLLSISDTPIEDLISYLR